TVFMACGDGMSFDDLKLKSKLTDDLIFLALDELKKQKLVKGDYQLKFKGASRREAIRRIGQASLVAMPFIAGIAAPRAAEAQSVACVAAGMGVFASVSGDNPALLVNGYFSSLNNQCCSGMAIGNIPNITANIVNGMLVVTFSGSGVCN